MKYIILAMIVIFTAQFAPVAKSAENPLSNVQKVEHLSGACQAAQTLQIFHLKKTITINQAAQCQASHDDQGNITVSQRGCCSHHSGVCGCSGGRAACCDGTLSPSCGC